MLTEALKEASATAAADLPQPQIKAVRTGDRLDIRLSGGWTTRTVGACDAAMRKLESGAGAGTVTIDLGAVQMLDTAGAWLMQRLATHLRVDGTAVTFAGADGSASTLLEAVGADAIAAAPKRPGRSLNPLDGLAAIGRMTWRARDELFLGMHILGAAVRGGQMKTGRRSVVSLAPVVSQVERMGVGAVPIVMLMSAIVGAIITQQSAFQLKNFAGQLFTVDLVSVLVLRELGVLMTAIMIAGRTGSAITAEIGSMKMREEIDALTVMGLNPIRVLVFPRLLGLLIALPCLTVAADAAALGGGILMAWWYADIPPGVFIQRMHDWIDLSTILSGMYKAPFMALIIGVVAAMEGLMVEGSAESLGRHVTASVVKAIFMVIVVDGFFAIFYGLIDY